MTGTSLVTTMTYTGRTISAQYVLPTHCVWVAAQIYLSWVERAKKRTLPPSQKMVSADRLLFRHFFPQFARATDDDILWAASDMAEDEVFRAAAHRATDPAWQKNHMQGMNEFLLFLKHEPFHGTFVERHPHLPH